jgi:hypothetical protein
MGYIPGLTWRSGWLDIFDDCFGTLLAIQTVFPLMRRSSRTRDASEKSLSDDIVDGVMDSALDVLAFVMDV